MSFADKTLTCRDCGMAFTFTAGEQDFYAQKGFANEPTRCPSCRQARKQERGGNDRFSSRDNYGSGYDRSGSRDNYSSYGNGYDRSGSRERYSSGYGRGYNTERGQQELHTATCSACGRPAQVPFVPRGDKPVYCSDCFQSQRSARGNARW